MNEVLAQYRAVREVVGLIDRSIDRGVLAIVGADRFSWLQGMVSNDVRLLQKQGACSHLPACILDATGHILTDLVLMTVSEAAEALTAAIGLTAQDFILIDLPRSNITKITTLLDRFLITEDVKIIDASDTIHCISLQGPNASAPLQTALRFSSSINVGAPPCYVAADHTGSGGIDSYFPAEQAGELIRLVTAARPGGLVQVEMQAREMLRVEAGIPLYGADMDESTIALEANLGPTHISLTKGCYVGQEIIARIDSRGHTNRALTGLVFTAGNVPKPGDTIRSEEEGREVGRITSVIPSSPAVEDMPIALGYVRHEHSDPGTKLSVGPPESALEATVRPLPFYQSRA